MRERVHIASDFGLFSVTVWLCGMLSAFVASPTFAAEALEQQQLVERARMTLEAFTADDGMKGSLKQLGQDSKGLLIVPEFMRGAFIFGGAGGSGVLIVRDEKTNKWGEPVFYSMGSVSFGLQAGGDTSEMVLVIKTQKGLEQFYSNDFKLGANVAVSAGPVGAGMSGQGVTADILSYAKTKGAFAGLALEGARVAVSNKDNKAYYGREVRPTDIIVKKEVSNPKSAPLRDAAEKLMK